MRLARPYHCLIPLCRVLYQLHIAKWLIKSLSAFNAIEQVFSAEYWGVVLFPSSFHRRENNLVLTVVTPMYLHFLRFPIIVRKERPNSGYDLVIFSPMLLYHYPMEIFEIRASNWLSFFFGILLHLVHLTLELYICIRHEVGIVRRVKRH